MYEMSMLQNHDIQHVISLHPFRRLNGHLYFPFSNGLREKKKDGITYHYKLAELEYLGEFVTHAERHRNPKTH